MPLILSGWCGAFSGPELLEDASVFEIHVIAVVLPSPLPVRDYVIALWQNVNSNVCRGGGMN